MWPPNTIAGRITTLRRLTGFGAIEPRISCRRNHLRKHSVWNETFGYTRIYVESFGAHAPGSTADAEFNYSAMLASGTTQKFDPKAGDAAQRARSDGDATCSVEIDRSFSKAECDRRQVSQGPR